jgi:hypothetical protein
MGSFVHSRSKPLVRDRVINGVSSRGTGHAERLVRSSNAPAATATRVAITRLMGLGTFAIRALHEAGI